VTAKVGAIVVAAGSSRRMAGIDKLWIDLGGKPLLARTIEVVSRCNELGQLVVVAGSYTLEQSLTVRGVAPWSRVDRWVPGGPTRQDSVWLGIQALDQCDYVLIHDGARPLVGPEMLERGMVTVQQHGSALAVVPVTDTIKEVDASGMVVSTLERAALAAAQTPQIFSWEIVVEAYRRAGEARATCTDDAGVMQLAGYPVYTYLGERTNIKVSTPEDVAVVRALWTARRA
jgi:2-C-methyl-D-erythritol 4-phosphate cytidylyltransferase